MYSEAPSISSLLLRNGALTGQEPLKFAVPDWKEDSQGEMSVNEDGVVLYKVDGTL